MRKRGRDGATCYATKQLMIGELSAANKIRDIPLNSSYFSFIYYNIYKLVLRTYVT